MKTKIRTFRQPDYTNGLLLFVVVAFAICAAFVVGC